MRNLLQVSASLVLLRSANGLRAAYGPPLAPSLQRPTRACTLVFVLSLW